MIYTFIVVHFCFDQFSVLQGLVIQGAGQLGPLGARSSVFEQYCIAAGVEHAEAAAVVERIAAADSPEEAARIGRGTERGQPMLLRPDWATAKLAVMYAGLRAKVCPS